VSGWGSGSWGFSPWGFGVDAPQVVSAVAVRENLVRLTFSEPILYTRTGAPRDGSRRELYAVTPVAGTSGFDGEAARPVVVGRVDAAGGGGTLLDLWLDRPLTHWPSRYVASAFGVYSTAGLPIDPAASSATFDGVRAGRLTIDPDRGSIVIGADIALPSTATAAEAARAEGALLGSYSVDATGDFAFDAGLQSLAKRVLRRLLAEPGAYAHLGPTYGAGLRGRVKRLANASERSRLVKLVEDQTRREPEVQEAGAELVAAGMNAWTLRLKVRTRFQQEATLSVPLRVDL
jgi:hypothetical protein